MEEFEKYKKEQSRTIFFTIKILAMFFFSVPIIEYLLEEIDVNEGDEKLITSALIVVFFLIACMAFIWIFVDKRSHAHKSSVIVEIILFFTMCVVAIWCSGLIESYYKFVFIFLVVLYTIQLGMRTGIIISAISSAVLLSIDLIFFKSNGINKYFENDIVLSAVFFIVAWALGFYVRMEKMQIDKLQIHANFDGLTQVYNHRYFYEIIKNKCMMAIDNGSPLALIMLDLDHFKVYNDIYGHLLGDDILKELAALLKQSIPENAVLCRYGGEEFSIILPDTDFEQSKTVAEHIRTVISNHYFFGQEHMPEQNLTISIGTAQFLGKNDTYKEFVGRADSALYRAKFLRRNSVEAYSSIFDEFNNDLEPHNREKLNSLKTLIIVINSRDSYTFNHVERVVYLCEVFANFMKLEYDDKKKLIYAAYLHDLGKINIDKEVLITDKKLNNQQWKELKQHPVDSAEIISKIDGFEDFVPIVLQHHEKFDGSGYPNGLKGEEISFFARMLSLADSFDAMTSQRPYQDVKTYDQAYEEIRRCSGTQFDPILAEKFISAVKNISSEYGSNNVKKRNITTQQQTNLSDLSENNEDVEQLTIFDIDINNKNSNIN